MPIQYNFTSAAPLPALKTFAELLDPIAGMAAAFVLSQGVVASDGRMLSVAAIAGSKKANAKLVPVSGSLGLGVGQRNGRGVGQSVRGATAAAAAFMALSGLPIANPAKWGMAIKLTGTGATGAFNTFLGDGRAASGARCHAAFESANTSCTLQIGAVNIRVTAAQNAEHVVVIGGDGTTAYIGVDGGTPVSGTPGAYTLAGMFVGNGNASAVSGLTADIRAVAYLDDCPFTNGTYAALANAMAKI